MHAACIPVLGEARLGQN